MKLMVSAILIFVFTGCTSAMLKKMNAKPSGVIPKELLGDNPPSEIARVSAEEYLTRSVSFSHGSIVKAILVLPTLAKMRELKKVDDLAYERKWDDARKKKEVHKINEKYKKKSKKSKGTCFVVTIDDTVYDAKNHKAWHGEVLQKGKKQKVSFTKFTGFSTTTTNVFGSGGSYNAYKTTDYTLFSTVCTEKAVELSETFVLRLEPRFRKGLGLLDFSWEKDDTAAKANSKECNNGKLKVPVKMFRGFSLQCEEDCRRLHPVNQKNCERTFSNHAKQFER